MKKVIELITKAGGKRDVRVNWDKLADELLRHFKTLQTREVSGRKRFLTHEEYKDEVGHYFEGEDIPRGQRHWQGKYKGVDGIRIQEKMGIEVQHEAIEGLTHSNAYDNAGMDLEENEDDIAEIFMDDDDEPESQMVDAFLLPGADYERTKSCIKSIFSIVEKLPDSDKTTFMEMYVGGSLCREANLSRRNLNLVGLNALGLRTTEADGSHWDLTLREDRRLARSMVDTDQPTWVIGSPPCTPFSPWNTAMNYPKPIDQDDVKKVIADGRKHLRFMISIYWKQVG